MFREGKRTATTQVVARLAEAVREHSRREDSTSLQSV